MYKILVIIMMHIAADFLLQDNTLSKLKTSNLVKLLAHVGIYTIFFIIISPLFLGFTFMQGLIFSCINGGAHLVVDFFTGKIKKRYWQKNETAFIFTISIDHLLHLSILFITFIYLYPEVWNRPAY